MTEREYILAGNYQKLDALYKRLKEQERCNDIMASALSEIMATQKGESDQPIDVILDGCIKEIRYKN